MGMPEFAVLGHPLGHTMSPFIHKKLFMQDGYAADYSVLDVEPEDLEASEEKLRELSGFNVTIPYKQAIISLLDELSEKASFFHSVNTVKNEGGRLVGHNTDSLGFVCALQAAKVPLCGRVAVLGAGGAARALAFEAALAGASVTVAARPHSLEAAGALAAELAAKVPGCFAKACLLSELSGQIDLLANATPVGMYPNTRQAPVSEKVLRSCNAVFDAVYNPNDTQLLKNARECGAAVVHGMDMLVWQAAAAQEIWNGTHFDSEAVAKISADAVAEMQKQFEN